MTKQQLSKTRFVVCLDNSGCPASLELHKVYPTIRDAAAERDGMLRVIDETGEDYLFPADRFATVALPPTTKRRLLRSRRAEHA